MGKRDKMMENHEMDKSISNIMAATAAFRASGQWRIKRNTVWTMVGWLCLYSVFYGN